MDASRFTSQEFGQVLKEPGNKVGFWYFKPEPVPRSVSLSNETVMLMSGADAAIGRLDGVGRLIQDPNIIVRPYITREAVASSRIEGTQASISDVLQAEVSDEVPANEDVQEVVNYQAALFRGIALLDELPLCLRLVKDVHAVLLKGVRGQERLPGEFRKSPVWIGGHTPDSAAFVPPIPLYLDEALADWEKFLNDDNFEMPILVKCALMHYQFETIHPFLDGNGRVGRLMVILMLMARGILEMPLLYLSAYIEDRKTDYYQALQAVRETGDLEGWIQYFLRAVKAQSEDATRRISKLVDLRETYRASFKGNRSRAIEVMELCFSNPFITVKRVENSLGVTNQGARNLITALEKQKLLREIGAQGRGGRVYWLAEKVYAAAFLS